MQPDESSPASPTPGSLTPPLPGTPIAPAQPAVSIPSPASQVTPPPPNLSAAAPPNTALITDVSASTQQLIRQHYLPQFILALAATVLAELGLVWLFAQSHTSGYRSGSSNNNGSVLVFPVILFLGWLARIKKQIEDQFISQFAVLNGFTYAKTGTVDETYGTLFRLPGRQKVSDVVRGNYLGQPFTLFLYERTVQSGRSSVKYTYTVMEYQVAGQLPGLLLTPHAGHFEINSLESQWHATVKVDLEGDFGQHYDVRVLGDDQIAAREIFTPDVMELIEERAGKISLEWVSDRLYLYHDKYIGKKADLDAMYNLAQSLGNKARKIAPRLVGEVSLPSPASLTQSRQNSQAMYWVVALIVFVVFLGAAVSIGTSSN